MAQIFRASFMDIATIANGLSMNLDYLFRSRSYVKMPKMMVVISKIGDKKTGQNLLYFLI